MSMESPRAFGKISEPQIEPSFDEGVDCMLGASRRQMKMLGPEGGGWPMWKPIYSRLFVAITADE